MRLPRFKPGRCRCRTKRVRTGRYWNAPLLQCSRTWPHFTNLILVRTWTLSVTISDRFSRTVLLDAISEKISIESSTSTFERCNGIPRLLWHKQKYVERSFFFLFRAYFTVQNVFYDRAVKRVERNVPTPPGTQHLWTVRACSPCLATERMQTSVKKLLGFINKKFPALS